jgi:predicted Zn-dependent peptidase
MLWVTEWNLRYGCGFMPLVVIPWVLLMSDIHYQTELPCGLTLIAESMDWVESAAMSLLLPVGAVNDPSDRVGLGNFACEMVQRGCGNRSSRQFVADLENLGVDLSGNVTNGYTSFAGAMIWENLPSALDILADLILRPLMPADQMEDARQVCLQEVRSLEDDLPQTAIQQLRMLHYPAPYGRSSIGSVESIDATTHDDIANYHANHYSPKGAILSVAGKFDWNEIQAKVEALFADWKSTTLPAIVETPAARGYEHISSESSQTHICMAFDGVPYDHDDYMQSRGAVGVMSDGVSSRLFTEVRERRGLCYTVSAHCHSTLRQGAIISYAGTTSDRAQETLDVILDEFHKLGDGVRSDELDRLKARIKSGLIMQQESSGSRAASLTGDYYFYGRIRPIDELRGLVDGLTCDSVNTFLKKHPFDQPTAVTLGPQPLEVQLGDS